MNNRLLRKKACADGQIEVVQCSAYISVCVHELCADGGRGAANNVSGEALFVPGSEYAVAARGKARTACLIAERNGFQAKEANRLRGTVY